MDTVEKMLVTLLVIIVLVLVAVVSIDLGMFAARVYVCAMAGYDSYNNDLDVCYTVLDDGTRETVPFTSIIVPSE